MFPRPVVVRRRRPLLRAAVVGGGAYAVGRAAANRSNAQATEVPAQAEAQPDVLDQLTQLNDLHEKGALTDTEFAAAKSRLLGGAEGSRP